MVLRQAYARLVVALLKLRESLRQGTEAEKATRFWGDLDSYHLSNDDDPVAIARSKWLATEILPLVSPSSLIEIGCNSGRNLLYIKDAYPEMRLKGIDVNPRAIEFAASTKPGIDFELTDANLWSELEDAWDCAITMSVIDHIPESATRGIAQNIASSCRAVAGVELWDGESGKRAIYKYSSDQRSVYESVGFQTIMWERVPDALQYDSIKSPLWIYVGVR